MVLPYIAQAAQKPTIIPFKPAKKQNRHLQRPDALGKVQSFLLSTAQTCMPSRLFSTFVLLSCLCAPSVATASPTDQQAQQRKEAELQRLQTRIEKVQQQLDADRVQEKSLHRDLRSAERKLAKTHKRLRELKRDHRKQKQRLTQLQAEKSTEQQNLRKHQRWLAQHIRSAYKQGQQEKLKLLLSLDQAGNVGRMLHYYQRLSTHQQQQLDMIGSQLRILQAKADAIATTERELANLVGKTETQRIALKQQRDQRKLALKQLQRNMAERSDELETMLGQHQQLQRLVRNLAAAVAEVPSKALAKLPFAKLKGKMRWPTSGRRLNRFGAARAGSQLRWQGVMIQAPAGQPVRAIAAGRVIYSDWLPHLGLLIIVEHSNGYLSLYGHNQELVKLVGDTVQPGDILSTVGNSGGQSDHGLYFEIRKKSKQLNPAKWCKKRALRSRG